MKSDVQTLVEKSYNELMKDGEQLEAMETSIKFAEEYLRVRQKAFKEGFATSIDLVDAQLALSKVKIERLKALYEFDVSFARLRDDEMSLNFRLLLEQLKQPHAVNHSACACNADDDSACHAIS